MGIRFERDNKKATNGPHVFFSILRDEVFEEEIRSAYRSGLSFYAYRFPGDSMLTFGSSEWYVEGLGDPGFVIGKFQPDLPFITIPYRGVSRTKAQSRETGIQNSAEFYKMPNQSTTFEEYSHEIEEIKKAIKEGEGEKVVAARVVIKEKDFDIADKFYEFCQHFPEAFVFCFSTPATGCWFGASPELLLEGREDILYSMALAGTRSALTKGDWDDKNIKEQSIVADYIEEIFRNNELESRIGDSFTKRAGNIEHICNDISAAFQQLTFGKENLEKLLRDLSPTPALCGYPKKFALKIIQKFETFDRGCYGGFCGPYKGINDFTFHVVLRCASISENRHCVYAGCGITAQSDVFSEWEETEMKSINF